jgi:hypothetical protein
MHQTEIFLMKQIEKYKAQVERVRELHKPFWVNEAHCSECYSKYDKDGKYSLYPCDTIKALDGEQ